MSPLIYLSAVLVVSIAAGTPGAILGLGGGMLLVRFTRFAHRSVAMLFAEGRAR